MQSTFACQLLIELLYDKHLCLSDDNHLYCVTSKHTRGQLGGKEKAAFSIKYLFVYSFRGKSIKDALSLSWQPTSYSCSPEFFNEKCAESCSELNGTIGRFLWSILKELDPFKCPKVWKAQKVFLVCERVKVITLTGKKGEVSHFDRQIFPVDWAWWWILFTVTVLHLIKRRSIFALYTILNDFWCSIDLPRQFLFVKNV